MTIGDRAIVTKGDFMGCIYPRGTKLWIRFKSVSGKWTQQKTGLDVGQEAKARKLLLEVEANVSAVALQRSRNQGEQRRLAGPVGPDHTDKFALLD